MKMVFFLKKKNKRKDILITLFQPKVRAYNIIGRADRYLKSELGASTKDKVERVTGALGVNNPVASQQNPNSQELLHEQVMFLISVTRSVRKRKLFFLFLFSN